MKIVILSLLLILVTDRTWAGWSGNGGDHSQDQDNIWFLGQDPVSYCVQRSEDYPLDQGQAGALVRESLNDWVTFFKKYQMDTFQLGTGADYSGIFPDKQARGISLQFVESQNCPDIIRNFDNYPQVVLFSFGIQNQIVQRYKNNADKNAMGLAVRRDYDHKIYRTGGVIWIDNFTTQKERIKHLLLHEIGHMLGVKHNTVFVMDEFIADELVASDSLYTDYFGRIESPLWKYRLLELDELDFTYNKGGKNGVPSGYLANKSMPSEIRQLLSMSDEGNYSLKLFFRQRPQPINHKEFHIIITEDNGTKHELVGDFGTLVHNERFQSGPGIYTQWLDPNSSDLYSKRYSVDSSLFPIPATGFFAMPKYKLAAIVAEDRGPVLKVFAPESGEWWIIKNFPTRQFQALTNRPRLGSAD